MTLQTHQTKLINKQAISDTVFKYKLTKPKGFSFIPGQYINIKVAKNARRSYSIASPNDAKELELIIDVSPNGPGSKFFKELNAGDTFDFLGPLGHMFISKESLEYKNIVFVSTGTGIAPFLAIFDFLEKNNYEGNVYNLYSEKFKKDIVKSSDFKNLKISSIVTLTRDSDSCYLKGRVTNHLDKVPLIPESLFFVCGNNQMVSDVCKYLEKNKIPKESIKREIYY